MKRVLFSHEHHQLWGLLKACPQIFSFQPWVVGVSAGADSLFLAEILWDLRPLHKMELAFVTVDHGIRDFSHEKELLSQCRFPVKLVSVENDLTDEASLRQIRYRSLHDHASPSGIVFTAHHEDDLIETVLMKLLRGGALASFASLPFFDQHLKRCRPIRGFKKSDIRAYLSKNQRSFIEDPTNKDLSYTRNQVREIIAALGPLGDNLGKRLVELSAQCEELKSLMPEAFTKSLNAAQAKERNSAFYRNLNALSRQGLDS